MIEDIQSLLKNYQPRSLEERRQYAVLLPLVEVDGHWHVLYEVRSENISQPGEVSFPGGRVEANENFETAAIRETTEELNLTERDIQLLGEIDYIVSGNRTIHCFIGQLLVDDWQTIKPNEEVARLFTIPLDLLMEMPPKYYTLSSKIKPSKDFPFDRIRNGQDYKFTDRPRQIPFYEQSHENLWGLTALLTHRFTEILKSDKK